MGLVRIVVSVPQPDGILVLSHNMAGIDTSVHNLAVYSVLPDCFITSVSMHSTPRQMIDVTTSWRIVPQRVFGLSIMWKRLRVASFLFHLRLPFSAIANVSLAPSLPTLRPFPSLVSDT